MEGFFSKKETESTTRPDGKTYSCVSCGLYKDCNSPKLAVSGGFKRGILNIGSMPSDTEDRRGKPFQSKYGRLLEETYHTLGIDLWEDCLNTYAIKCAPKQAPTPYQLDCCRKYLLKVIEEYKPKVIVVFGEEALYSILGKRWKNSLGNIEKWQGFQIPDQDLLAYICPTFSLETAWEAPYKIEKLLFKEDLKKAVAVSKFTFPKYKEPKITYLEDDLSVLNTIKTGIIAFDYETTGLKPHAAGHKIKCASVAINEDTVYSFIMPDTKQMRKPFTDLLQNKMIGKIAQNMKFEDTWTKERLKIPVNNWVYDTMLATHIVDNRSDITGLKFQTYVQFGVVDYAGEVAPYLKAVDDGNGNSINRIEELLEKPNGKELVLKYCALDSIFEYRLAMLTKKSMLGTQGESVISPINSNFPAAYNLLHNGIIALAKAERQGLRIDTEYAERKKMELTAQITELETNIFASNFYKRWQHSAKTKVNLNSGPMLGNYLYNIRKLTPPKLTDTGKGSTDDEALKMLKIPELDWIVERSKLKKVRDTYLEAFIREQVKEYLHPFFNLHLARTYRSSSSNPNFQNIPKRDKVAMDTVRRAIYPRPGNQLLEMDFSGIEVAIAAAYHKDPTMIKYITDPLSDMHGDMAKQIFIIKDFDKHKSDHKTLRAAAKNGFVFPQFYGDYYKNNADSICGSWVELPQSTWTKDMGMKMKDGTTLGSHLIKSGIKSYDQFCEHVKRIEKDFWENRFPVYNKWKKSHYEAYLKNGYISLKTGFVCKGVMSFNDVSNYPVQGAAFHCLLWTFTALTDWLEEKGYKTKLVGQIHDALVLDVYPPELESVYLQIQRLATIELPKAFSWINVPLAIEAELCPINSSWADKNEYTLSADDLPF